MTAAKTRAARLAGLAAVAGVHAIMIALLLSRQGEHPRPPVGEHIVWLAPLPPPPSHRPAARGKTTAPAYAGPDYRGITLSFGPPSAGTSSLGHALFDCLGKDKDRLTPEERAHCPGANLAARPSRDFDFHEPRERSVAAALWQRGRARKNAPLLLPCMDPQAAGISLGTLLCLGQGALNGFDLDGAPGYGDKPEQIHVPNGGDPPDKPN